MTQRSIRRAQQRRTAADERRAALRRRRATLAAAAALGSGALLAPAAPAATFEVNSTHDGEANACGTSCKLRDAIVLANANAEDDTITFASGVTGAITLRAGQLAIASEHDLTIQGPGAAKLAVSGADSTRVFETTGDGHATISGLTIRAGAANSGAGVRVLGDGGATIADARVSDNNASGGGAGVSAYGPLTVTRSEISGNVAPFGGGIVWQTSGYSSPETLTITDSEVSGNSGGGVAASGRVVVTGTAVTDNSGGSGIRVTRALTVSSSTISGNSGTSGGGILMYADYPGYGPLNVSDSRITGNHATAAGGGISFVGTRYGGSSSIERTTIAGNTAAAGGGMSVGFVPANERLTISHSTISGNDATAGGEPGRGGGLAITGQVRGHLDLLDSTVSGNVSDVGGGVSVAEGRTSSPRGVYDDTIAFRNSTIASNTALARGGGVFLGAYDPYGPPAERVSPVVRLASTIVADNAGDDLDRADDSTRGGFDSAFSLVETPSGDAALTQSEDAPGIVGADPQLGPLAGNGGPTLTHLPARTSPVVDRGHGDPRDTDQRGQPRVVDNEQPNPVAGDGTDIGAVELDKPAPAPLPPGDPPPGDPPPDDPPLAHDLLPQAVIKHNGLRAKRASKRFVTGLASDDRAVSLVEVAIVRKRGGRCRHLLASGRFSRATRCGGPRSFLSAEGTTRWRFNLRQRLDRGYYVVYSRAVDDAGQTQLSFGTKSRRPFRVR